MSTPTPVLATMLFVPPLRPDIVPRPLERLDGLTSALVEGVGPRAGVAQFKFNNELARYLREHPNLRQASSNQSLYPPPTDRLGHSHVEWPHAHSTSSSDVRTTYVVAKGPSCLSAPMCSPLA